MKQFFEFLSYHNAVPIAFGVLFLGSGAAFAASPEAREAVFSATESVVSIDNTRIVGVDVETLSLEIGITDVQEDDDNYYVTYTLATIDLVDYVWQDVIYEEIMTVNKQVLRGRDLGLYVTKELAEVRESERVRLFETQKIEQESGVSQKVVATAYSGLIGQFLDEEAEVLPGYAPVIPEPTDATTEPGTAASTQNSDDSVPPAITILGDNPARIPLRSVYEDLGVVVTDNQDGEIGYTVLVDGVEVEKIEIDTSRVWAYVITYRAVDSAGNTSEAVREVVVDGEGSASNPVPDPTPDPEPTATTTPSAATTTPDAAPDPEPAPQETATTTDPAPEAPTQTETATSTPE